MRKRMFRRRRITVGVALLLALCAGYVSIVAVTPLPPLHMTMSVEPEIHLQADETPAIDAVNGQSKPTATGWLGDDEVWSNNDGAFRIASLTKLITVLVGLEKAPVEAGTNGPKYTLSAADSRLIQEVLAQDGLFAPVPVGQSLTTKQMLELILLPSANNYAISYSRWVFGSDKAFLSAAKDWLQRHELSSVHIYDAAGLNDKNVASAADMVRITRLVLDNPLLAEIVSMSEANIPGIGRITTTNHLLGDAGVIGVKTGTTFPEGYSLSVAKKDAESGRELVTIAVVLDRADGKQRNASGRAVLAATTAAWQQVTVVDEGETIGSVTIWNGKVIPLKTTAEASVVLVPGESAARTVKLTSVGVSEAGTTVGTVTVVSPEGEQEVAVATTATILAPTLWWKLTHPTALWP